MRWLSTHYALWLAPLLIAAGGLLSLALGQDASWDLRYYHWYNGFAFWHDRFAFDMLAAQQSSFHNPLFDALFYAGATAAPPALIAFVLGAVHAANPAMVFLIAKRLGLSPIIAGAIGLASFWGGGALEFIGTTFHDNILSLAPLAAIYLFLGAAPSDNSQLFWRVAAGALLLGAATGIKLVLAPFALAFLIMLVAYPKAMQQRGKIVLVAGAALALGFVLTYAWWGWMLWQEYQNPFFPYFNNIFGSPYAAAQATMDTQYIPSGLAKLYFPLLFLLDRTASTEFQFTDLKVALVWALGCAYLLLAGLRRTGHVPSGVQRHHSTAILVFYLTSYVLWQETLAIYRYGILLEFMAPLIIVLLLQRLVTNAQIFSATALALCLISMVGTAVYDRAPRAFAADYISVKPLAKAPESNIMVLVAGFQPSSFLLPSLAADLPVTRLPLFPAMPLMTKKVLARLDGHKGAFWLLAAPYELPWLSRRVLPLYGFVLTESGCQIVVNNIDHSYRLCPVTRKESTHAR